jgi:hypothetical protein
MGLRAYRDPEKRRAQRWREKARARLVMYGHPPVLETFTRADVVALYGDRCRYCANGPFEHLDHVVPLCVGGHHTLINVRPSCAACNNRKQGVEARIRGAAPLGSAAEAVAYFVAELAGDGPGPHTLAERPTLRPTLLARIAELEAENARLREDAA